MAFLVSSGITAAVHDGKNQHAIRFQTVQNAIALHNNFSYRFIVSFWNLPTAFRKGLQSSRGKHDLLAEASGIKRRVATNVTD
ncbi:hypothetical protein A1355_06835 [Methylomonas koyamae]|uniref:Uncharacterized protein n=1 Tax=Methylomonas koyamae TaxID=702114 RepID=A0A177NIU7_9GAMM|nr:hypothetical protein A1355_06835 [Methylomonas koyamae]